MDHYEELPSLSSDEKDGDMDNSNGNSSSSSSDDEVLRPLRRTPAKSGGGGGVRRSRRVSHRREQESDSDSAGEGPSTGPMSAKRRAFKELRERRMRRIRRATESSEEEQAEEVKPVQEEEKEEEETQEIGAKESPELVNLVSSCESDASDVVSPAKKSRKSLQYSDESEVDEASNEEQEEKEEEAEDEGDGDASSDQSDFILSPGDFVSESEVEDAFSDDGDKENDSGGSDSFSDDEGAPAKKKADYRSELNDILAGLSRSTEKDRLLTRNYHGSLYEDQLQKTPRKKKKKSAKTRLTYSSDDGSDGDVKDRDPDIMKVKIYEPLMEALRPLGSREGLTDVEIIKEFLFYDLLVDEECGGECICGKEGLKYNFFIWNKNIEDVQKRTLEYKVCVGSECINHFQLVNSPIAFYMNLLVKGTLAYYTGKTKGGILKFNLGGIAHTYLSEHWGVVAVDYKLPVTKDEKKRPGEEENGVKVFRARMRMSKKLKLDDPLLEGARYRIRVNAFAAKKPKFKKKTEMGFRLVAAVRCEKGEGGGADRRRREDNPRSFIKNL